MYKSRAWLEIDLNAIGHNIDEFKKKSPKIKIFAMVKADAYGHGAIETAKFLEGRGDVAGFAVATPDEALALRGEGIKKAILMLGPAPKDALSDLILNGISLTVGSMEDLLILSDCAKAAKTHAPLHIKVDIGMNRLGFKPTEDAINAISAFNLQSLSPQGVFTHFPCADEPNRDKLTAAQYLQFCEFSQKLSKSLGRPDLIYHAANSAAAWRLSELNFDYARLGISLYGLPPSEAMKDSMDGLKPAMSVRAQIARVSDVGKGEKIGYGATFIAEDNMRIATVCFGYGDGYPRELSNMGYCLIRGCRAPIVGRVCMDYFMADVSKIPEVLTSDTATIIGSDGDNEISLMKLSMLSGRFHYELSCGLGLRVKKIYF